MHSAFELLHTLLGPCCRTVHLHIQYLSIFRQLETDRGMTASCSHFLLRFLIHATAERCQLNWWRDGRLRQWSRLVKFRPLQRRSNSFDAGRRVARDYSRVCGCAPGRIWCRQPDLRNTSKYIAGIDTKRGANSSWTYDCLICLHWPYIWTKLFSFF